MNTMTMQDRRKARRKYRRVSIKMGKMCERMREGLQEKKLFERACDFLRNHPRMKSK